ncbi:MAG: NHL repeat-containing protein [Spirochaetaceae bacterium]|jgi:DNA-binding beta-propeller fold protein YncE|nr:NHL repeat-containing protein [Spirochaetaceae bacterium]
MNAAGDREGRTRRPLPGGPGLFFALLVLAALSGHPSALNAQQGDALAGIDRSAMNAREEFRLGVQAYNRYAFNEAILSLERALSFRPGEGLILDWLGRAYFRSGLEDTALRQWQAAAAAYGPSSGEGLLIMGRIETVRNRRSLFPAMDEDIRYVEAGRYPGTSDDTVLYRQPTAVLPLEDGSAWVVAYGSNELVRIDVNGMIRQRRRGPLNGFDRPYDLVRGLDGRLYLSEFRGGRVSILSADGEWLGYIGSKGLGDGQLMGPQNLAVDEEGYLYVVDYGNRRISKFTPDGEFILSFGDRRSGFQGLLSPTGIAAGGGRIFIADGAMGRIFIFDRNGTYRGILVEEGLSGPESLRFLSERQLLAADTNRLLLIDVDSAVVRELGVLGNSRVRIVGADADRNGNILAANFQAGEVSVMTPLNDMAAGLFVQIDRVVPDNFPEITLEVQVQDRRRRPVVGLNGGNFLLSEESRAVSEQNFMGGAYRTESSDVAILMERSPETLPRGEDLAAAVRDIRAGGSRVVSLVSAGEQALRERLPGDAGAAGFAAAARGNPASYSPRWRFDQGLRLAATDLLPGSKKRAVVFVGHGSLGELAFEQYSLSELAAYLTNNGIRFYAVIAGDDPPAEELRYLSEQTGGQALPLYRPQGIRPVLESLGSAPSGSYTLRYRSQLPTDFGRAYLSVEAEVYLLERSGRDKIGYFAPLE